MRHVLYVLYVLYVAVVSWATVFAPACALRVR